MRHKLKLTTPICDDFTSHECAMKGANTIMSENQISLQLLTIPAPLYKHGDFVEWSNDFGDNVYVYRGYVVYRSWTEDYEPNNGVWEYGLESTTVTVNGVSRPYSTDDFMPEPFLRNIHSFLRAYTYV